MKKAELEVVKTVIEKSRLTNQMVAEAFGFENSDALKVEFLNTYGETVAEFRKRCKTPSQFSSLNNRHQAS